VLLPLFEELPPLLEVLLPLLPEELFVPASFVKPGVTALEQPAVE
jgi:hypothetical protein